MVIEYDHLPAKLPPGWVVCSLDEITDIIMGQSPPSSTYNKVGEGLPFFQGKADFNDMYPTPRVWCTEPSKVAEKDDVLISVRAPVGPTNLAPERSCIGRGLAALRPLGGIEPPFIIHMIRAYETDLASRGTGSTFTAITGDTLRRFPIPLPPLAEQRRIVDKITSLHAGIEIVGHSLSKGLEQLDLFRQSLLSNSTVGELTRGWRDDNGLEECSNTNQPLAEDNVVEVFPYGWMSVQLTSLLKAGTEGIRTGPFGSLLKKHEHQKQGVPVFGIENVRKLKFLPDNKIFITEEKARHLSAYDAKAGDILVTRSGTVGDICVVPDGFPDARISSNLMRLRVDRSQVTPHYLALVLYASPDVLGQLYDRCRGTTRVFLNAKIISSLTVTLPPLAEQEEIVRQINKSSEGIDRIKTNLSSSIEEVGRLTESVLALAFEGKLVPQDPNDEPASILLERIRAERTKGKRKRAKVKEDQKGLFPDPAAMPI